MRVFKKKAKRWEGAGRPPTVALSSRSSVAGERGRIREALGGEGAAAPALRVSDPRDAAEIEADRVAAAVMRDGGPDASPVPLAPGASLQRQCACEEDETLARKTAAEEEEEKKKKKEEEMVHTKAAGDRAGGTAEPAAAEAVRAVATGGEPLPEPVRRFFEARLGRELAGVRIHTGAGAQGAARDVRAEAFTYRNHVAFATGRYAPETAAGRALLAHELAHVVQQGYAPTAAEKATPVGPAAPDAPRSEPATPARSAPSPAGSGSGEKGG